MEATTESIIAKIESSYSNILRLYQSVPVSVRTEPIPPRGWSVKDILGNIAAWEWRCALLLNEAHDTDALLKARPDVKGLDHEIYNERQTWGWEEIENDFHKAHQTLIEAIHKFPSERLKDPIVQATIAEDTWKHYELHLPYLQRWHKRVVSAR